MSDIPCRVFRFLTAVEGNWRNAIHIECRKADCPHAGECAEVLFAADADGSPILMPVPVLRACGAPPVDKYECAGCLERSAFIAAYRRFLDWQTDTDGDCALRRLLESQPLPLCGISHPPKEKSTQGGAL